MTTTTGSTGSTAAEVFTNKFEGKEPRFKTKQPPQSQPPLFNELMILQRHNFPIDPYDDLLLEPYQQQHASPPSISELQSNSSSDSSTGNSATQDLKTKHVRGNTGSRNLLFGTATRSICSLSGEMFYFNQDPITQLYFWNGDKNDMLYSDVDSIWNSTVLDRWNVADQIQARHNISNATTSDGTVAVRACLCTQYLNRPIEFCSAEFLSCSVKTSPVNCFTLSSTDAFIEFFWPITVFWMLVVLYVWLFSDPGRIARQYYQRKFRCWICRCNRAVAQTNADTNTPELPVPIEGHPPTHASMTDDEMVRQQLDSIIENYPSRANYMYREAMSRQNRLQRYEQERQRLLWYRNYQRIKRSVMNFFCCVKSNTAANSNVIANDENENRPAVEMTSGEVNNLDASPSLTVPSGPRLLLKTKVYYFDDVAARAATDPTRKHSLPEQPQAEFSESTSDLVQSKVGTITETNFIDDDDDDNSNNNHNNSGDEIRCAICLLPLQDRIDVIGKLPCHHCMHKHCLKEWLMRKNRCPLCQLSNVAVFQDTTHTS
jgi:Ring finger domain